MTLSYRQRKEKDTIPNTIKYTWQKRRAHHAKPSHAAHTHTTHMRSIMELEMERPGNLTGNFEGTDSEGTITRVVGMKSGIRRGVEVPGPGAWGEVPFRGLGIPVVVLFSPKLRTSSV